MPWSLSAHGEASPGAEAELQQKLAELLFNPKYGTTGSQWHTASHNGPLPGVAKKKKADG